MHLISSFISLQKQLQNQILQIFIQNQSSENPFLSDPSPIIGYACQWLTHWLLFSKLDDLEWYQLLHDVATAT